MDRKNYWIIGAVLGLVIGLILGITISIATTPAGTSSDIGGGAFIGLLAIGLPLFCILGGIVKSRTAGETPAPKKKVISTESDDDE